MNLYSILEKLRVLLSSRNSKISDFILVLLAQLRRFLVFSGFYGAKSIRSDGSKVTILKLNRTTSLGRRGELVHLPSDRTISDFVRQRGTWELDECLFLATEIEALGKLNLDFKRSLFLDIGANSGLISRQVRTLINRDIEIILIEPIPLHVEVIRSNLSKYLPNLGIRIFQGALSNADGQSEIYIQTQNRGNTSLYKGAMLGNMSEKIQIDLIDTVKFAEKYLSMYSNIILKSDTQGFDARILSLIPLDIWHSVRAAVIEIWALPDIDPHDVSKLISIWHKIPTLRFTSSSNHANELTLDEIEQIWCSKSGKSFNLRLTSTILE